MRMYAWTIPLLFTLVTSCAPLPPPQTGDFSPELGVDPDAMRDAGGGLWIRDLREGSGPEVGARSTVVVVYTLWLADGTLVQDSRAEGAGVRVQMGAEEVIAGMERGLRGMRAGGRRQLIIPPRLGYGRLGTEVVPPNSTLVFDIEVVDVR
jgi:FKBP-type peptidyl-prolyl cis-trans isomerase